MTPQSNLDMPYVRHPDFPECPCLPAVWWMVHTGDDGEQHVVLRAFHDPSRVARVLRQEGGHP